jgi:hypothetical protein
MTDGSRVTASAIPPQLEVGVPTAQALVALKQAVATAGEPESKVVSWQ